MSAPTTSARQHGRIARLLGVDAADVTGLDDIPETDLAILHDQISSALFADGRAQFANVASLSKLLPGAVAGKLAEKFLPAVLAARVAELLEPNRARDLVNRVSVHYLGDLALVLDPVRSKPVVQAIPAPRVGEVARELFDRGEYAAMAEFVGTVTVDALFAALGAATPHDLLAVVPLLDWNDNLDHVIAHLPAEQVAGIVAELTPVELADLALALDPSRFGPIVHAVPVETVEAIAAELFQLRECAAMAAFVGVVTPDMLHAALGVATGHDLLAVVPLLDWNDNLDHVIAHLPAEQVAGIVAELTPVELADLALALDPSRFGPIVHAVPVETVEAIAAELFQRREYAAMAAFVGVVTPDMLHAALGVATGHDLLAVVPLLDWNDNLDHVIATADVAQLDNILEAMIAEDLWGQGNALIDQLAPATQQHLLTRVGDLSETNFAAIKSAAAAGKLSDAARTLVAAASRQRHPV